MHPDAIGWSVRCMEITCTCRTIECLRPSSIVTSCLCSSSHKHFCPLPLVIVRNSLESKSPLVPVGRPLGRGSAITNQTALISLSQHRDRTLNASANQSAPSPAALPYVSLYGGLLRIKIERLEVRFSAKASLLPDGAALAAAACFQH